MKVKAQTLRGTKIQWVYLRKGEAMLGFNPEKQGFYRMDVAKGEVTYLGRQNCDWEADVRDNKANGWTIQTQTGEKT